MEFLKLMDREYAEYLLKKTKDDYNLIAADFSRTRARPWEELKFLGDCVLAGEKVLDLGCGNGRLLEIFKDKRIEYFGVDASEKLIEIAKKRYPPEPLPPAGKDKKEIFLPQVRFQVADALNLPFPNNFFDKIFSIAIFHQIPSKEFRLRFLKEAKRVLKSEGQLILTVWKFHQVDELYLIFKYTILKLLSLSKLDFGDIFEPWAKKIKRYYHCFSQKELLNLVKKAGFKIKEAGIVKNQKGNRQNIYLIAQKCRPPKSCPCNSMDRMGASGAQNVGSIPTRGTF